MITYSNPSDQQYDVEVDGQLRHIEMVGTQRTTRSPQLIDPHRPARPPFLLCIDCLFLCTLIVLPYAFSHSQPLFVLLTAFASSMLLTVYAKLVWRVLCVLGPPDRPHVIAIIKAPEKLFCPRCGDDKTDDYCSNCGVNVQREYKKAVRKLAQYVVDATDEPRRMLEASLQGHINEIAVEQRERVEKKLAMLERQYVMEIVRQKKMIETLQKQLPGGAPALSGRGLSSCRFG